MSKNQNPKDKDPLLIDLIWEVHREVGAKQPMRVPKSLSEAQVESLLYSTEVDHGPPGRDNEVGHRRGKATATTAPASEQPDRELP